MSTYFSADWIFPVSSPPIKNGIVEVNSEGEIIAVFTEERGENLNIEKLKGAIVPGFINTHCHLELSHLLGKISERTGLVDFVKQIISGRQAENDEIKLAMQNADKQMYNNGIVAVADISNQISSKEIKQKSKIYYHTFVEAMGFNPERAKAIMDYAIGIKNEFFPLPASVVPHAPYSLSPELFKLINEEAESDEAFISIHNQETVEENSFFTDKTGGFLELYKFLGLDIGFFKPSGKSSLQTWLPNIKNQKLLLVHNTVSSKEDIEFALQNHHNLYWCICPNANLYIEDKLPDVNLWMEKDLKITMGTDSLASNNQLNILAEMKTLQQLKNVGFESLLQWATINGAEFLGLDRQLGTIEVGKKPGLNLVSLSKYFTIENDVVIKLV
ncbi:amidohydrolase family protein [Pedobacter jejuensis]|uniref:Amidohydrolase n=1 Tax=Pedobacter jejuensis TaxID=1268550 RepID=A0A3N0BLF9_9SPHI|nr:amidohydrolase family protein [Pedobacter jejuensis]RNL49586.1 amidohydrolase [Pedobacter jejuensis]